MFSHYLITWILFFVPLLFLPIFEDPFRFSKIVFFYFCAALLIATNSVKIFQKKQIILPNKKLLTVYCLLITVYFLSTIFSIHLPTSLFGIHHVYIGSLIHLIALLIFSFSVLQINWKESFHQVSAYISAAASIASIFAIVQFSQFFYDFGQLYRVRSTIGEPNRLSFFLSAALPFCLFLFFKTTHKLLKFISFLNCLLVLTTIFLTLSRSSWIALFLTFISIVFLYLKTKPRFSLKKFAQENRFYLITTILIVSFSLPFLGAKILDRNLAVIRDLKTGGGSLNLRLKNWQVVWQTIKNREKWYQHFLGTGPSTISYTFLKNRPASFNQNPLEKNWITSVVRNQFLDILTNTGIFGLTSFAIMIIIFLFYIFKNLKTLAKNPIFWPIFSCFLVILFTSFLYYQTITTSIYFWFAIGILTSFLNKQKVKLKINYRSSLSRTSRLSRCYTGIARRIMLLLFEPVENFCRKTSRLEFISSLSRACRKTQKIKISHLYLISGLFSSLLSLFFLTRIVIADLNFTQGNFEKAVKINPYHDFYKRQLAHLLLKQAEDNKDLGKAKLAIKTAQEAVKLNPLSAVNQHALQHTNYRSGVVFNKNFHYQGLEAGKKRIKLDPTHAGPYDTQGLIYLDMGKLEKALEHFKKAVKIDPDNLESYLHIGEALKQMGRIEKAIEYYQTALAKNPNWPFAQEELKKAQSLLDKE